MKYCQIFIDSTVIEDNTVNDAAKDAESFDPGLSDGDKKLQKETTSPPGKKLKSSGRKRLTRKKFSKPKLNIQPNVLRLVFFVKLNDSVNIYATL